MILITYNVRDGAEADGYEQWLRDVDNPFFNSVPGIRHYTNWKVTAAVPDQPFRFVDFLVVDDVTRLEDVWFHPDLNRFRTEWVGLWGLGRPDPPNARCYLCERTSPGQSQAHFGLFTTPAPSQGGAHAVWRTTKLLHKHYSAGPSQEWQSDNLSDGLDLFRDFAIAFADSPFDASPGRDESGAFSFERIASPDLAN